MLKLQNETKCHNINLVTPEHVVPQVIEAIYYAVEGGLNIPIVYNTSSYDSMKSLQVLGWYGLFSEDNEMIHANEIV